jgi:hypothetical protein
VPRAKKAPLYKSHYTLKRFALDLDPQKHFARHLGIEKGPARIKEMVADVEEVLTLHQCGVQDLGK